MIHIPHVSVGVFGTKEFVAVYEPHIDLVAFNLKHLHERERNFENFSR